MKKGKNRFTAQKLKGRKEGEYPEVLKMTGGGLTQHQNRKQYGACIKGNFLKSHTKKKSQHWRSGASGLDCGPNKPGKNCSCP